MSSVSGTVHAAKPSATAARISPAIFGHGVHNGRHVELRPARNRSLSRLDWAAAATLPPEITARLLADVDVIARRMTRRIAAEIALPAQFRTIGYLRTVTGACRDALRTLVRLLRDGRGLRTADLQRLGSMGAQQAEMGVPARGAARRLPARGPGGVAGADRRVGAARRACPGHRHRGDRPGARVPRRDQRRGRLRLPGDPRAADAPARPRPRPHPPAPGRRRRQRGAAPARRRQRPRPAPPYLVLACAVGIDDGRAARSSAALRAARRAPRRRPARHAGSRWSRRASGAGRAPRGGRARRCRRRRAALGRGPASPPTLEDVAESARRAREALAASASRLDPAARAWDDAAVGVFATLAADPEAMRRYVEPRARRRARRARRRAAALSAGDARGAAGHPERSTRPPARSACTATPSSTASAGSPSSGVDLEVPRGAAPALAGAAVPAACSTATAAGRRAQRAPAPARTRRRASLR